MEKETKHNHEHEHTHKHEHHEHHDHCECGCHDHNHNHDHGHHDHDHHHDHHDHHHDHHDHHDHDPDGCDCGHCHGERKTKEQKRKMAIKYSLGVIPVLIGFLGHLFHDIPMIEPVAIISSLLAYALFGIEIWRGMVKGFINKKIFTEFTLMCVATLGAFAIGEFADAAALTYLYSLGESISDGAYSRSKNRISSLLEIVPAKVNLSVDNEVKEVSPESVRVGDVILVRAGESIALDGVCVSGGGIADAASVTGESSPLELYEGVACLSGSVLCEGSVYLKVTSAYQDSTAYKMQKAVEQARTRRASAEKKISRFAAAFTPFAFAVAALVFVIGALVTGDVASWAKSAIVVLVVACPCSLVLSVPLTYFAGLGNAATKGIIFRGGEVMDKMATVRTVVFDKTGTITEAGLTLSDVVALSEDMSEQEIRDVAFSVLLHSPHVAAKAFCASVENGKALEVTEVNNISGKGIVCTVNGKRALFGNARLMQDFGIEAESLETTYVLGAYDGKLICRLDFEAALKPEAKQIVPQLYAEGIHRVAVISGDVRGSVKKTCAEVGIDEFYCSCTPDQKLSIFEGISSEEKLKNKRSTAAFCGDGLNDSAVINAADIGIAMGSGGSALTVDSADVVLMDNDLFKIIEAKRIAKRTMRIANFNIVISLAIKAAVVLAGLAFAAFGVEMPVFVAIIADVGAVIATVLNSLRAAK